MPTPSPPHAERKEPDARPPSVLFVCVKNASTSQMAAGLMRKAPGNRLMLTPPAPIPPTVNDLSAKALLEVGVDITGQTPKAITPAMVRGADLAPGRGGER